MAKLKPIISASSPRTAPSSVENIAAASSDSSSSKQAPDFAGSKDGD
jgi:hypothetical protein